MNGFLLRIKSYEAHGIAVVLNTQSEQSFSLVKVSFSVARTNWETTKTCD